MSRTYHHGDRHKPALFGNAWHWYSSGTPRYWRRLYKHKPRRAAARRSQHEVLCGNYDVLWPLDTQPQGYYW